MPEDKSYSKKDIFNLLRQVKQEIIENCNNYNGINKDIYAIGTKDSVHRFDIYIELDKDLLEDLILRYTKESLFKQLESIRINVHHLKKEYTGQNKDTYDQCIKDIVKIVEKYMEIYQVTDKWRRLG